MYVIFHLAKYVILAALCWWVDKNEILHDIRNAKTRLITIMAIFSHGQRFCSVLPFLINLVLVTFL